MKTKVIRKARVISLMTTALMLLVLLGRGNPQTGQGGAPSPSSATCPSPVPSCAASVPSPSNLFGQYGCTMVETTSTGVVQVQVLTITADGNGNITTTFPASNQAASSSNNPSGSTFSPFTASAFAGGTYCLNADDTGYIYPPAGASACPLALVIDSFYDEVRLIDTTENQAGAMTCEAQFEGGSPEPESVPASSSNSRRSSQNK